MRKSRYQKGSVKKQDGRWVAMWWVDRSHKSRVIGLVKDMTKSEARAIVDGIVTEAEAKQSQNRAWTFGEFVEEVYFPYYSRKWKASTRVNNMNRVRIHLVDGLGTMVLGAFRRDGLQDVLDDKAKSLSFSTVDHLRWDLKQIFDLAMAEGLLVRNPALLLFTPKDAAKPVRKVMNMKEVQMLFGALDQRERLVAKLAVMAGMRPGEIFALTWGTLQASYVDIRQRVYRGQSTRPKPINPSARPLCPRGSFGISRSGG
jgi:integrase